MPQFRVLKRSTQERIYVDKIDKREHLHITGAEFTDSQIKSMSEQYGSNTFKEEKAAETPVEVVEEKVEETEIIVEAKPEEITVVKVSKKVKWKGKK